MIDLNAYVIEISPKKYYRVIIEDICDDTVIANGYQYAFALIIEDRLAYDYDYVEVARGVTDNGLPYRKYVLNY